MAAPAAPIPAVATPSPAIGLTPFLGPPQVLALQRTAGNRAVTALLQRAKKGSSGSPEPITANDVVVAGAGGKPTVTGNTHAALSNVGPDSTRIIGPTMQVSAKVDLATGVDLAGPLNVGYIQNMKAGDRIAVSGRPGSPRRRCSRRTAPNRSPSRRPTRPRSRCR